MFNDMYAKDISKKIKSVKRDKQRKGQFIGGKPMYGYKMHPTEKNEIVIDEEVAPVVRRIFAIESMWEIEKTGSCTAKCRKVVKMLQSNYDSKNISQKIIDILLTTG